MSDISRHLVHLVHELEYILLVCVLPPAVGLQDTKQANASDTSHNFMFGL